MSSFNIYRYIFFLAFLPYGGKGQRHQASFMHFPPKMAYHFHTQTHTNGLTRQVHSVKHVWLAPIRRGTITASRGGRDSVLVLTGFGGMFDLF